MVAFIEGFLKGEGDGPTIQKLVQMVHDPKRLLRVRIELAWMVAHLGHLHNILTWAETDREAVAPFVMDRLATLQTALQAGCTRTIPLFTVCVPCVRNRGS
jgi:hypothetical protein